MDDEKSDVDLKVSKRRQAVNRWKENHREYYLEQKRRLAHRPEYLQHRREMYKAKRIAGPLAARTSGERSEDCAFNTLKDFLVVEKQTT